jgi:D-glycero-alpha-D-manno-heptose-7-phosphate kinase
VSTIVSRAPLRLALGGGGTDLPSYYREHGGFVVSAAIDRYVHLSVKQGTGNSRFRLEHLELEEVDRVEDVRHPILRAALEHHWSGGPLELSSSGDVPPGTGLGSSGSYTVCTLKALAMAAGLDLSPKELAEAASRIEIEILDRPVGKQDQYAAALGGVRAYTFQPDGRVEARPLRLPEPTLRALREQFLLFNTGEIRSAAEILSHQVKGTLAGDARTAENLHRGKQLAIESGEALEEGDLTRFAELMEGHWEVKRARAPGAVTERAEELRRLAVEAGALGVMLMGAGGGGFLLAYTTRPEETRLAMEQARAPELQFGLDHEGCVALAS